MIDRGAIQWAWEGEDEDGQPLGSLVIRRPDGSREEWHRWVRLSWPRPTRKPMATKSFRMTSHVPRNNSAGDVNDRNNSADSIAGIPLAGLKSGGSAARDHDAGDAGGESVACGSLIRRCMSRCSPEAASRKGRTGPFRSTGTNRTTTSATTQSCAASPSGCRVDRTKEPAPRQSRDPPRRRVLGHGCRSARSCALARTRVRRWCRRCGCRGACRAARLPAGQQTPRRCRSRDRAGANLRAPISSRSDELRERARRDVPASASPARSGRAGLLCWS